MKANDVIATYERIGLQWARHRNKTLIEKQWLDRMLAVAPRASGVRRILDLGCGSGHPIGSYLAERGAQMTGVDATSALSSIYPQNVAGAQAIKADMRELCLDRKFDAIIAWDSFFHFSVADQTAMFATFAQHAVPDAALMFTSGHIDGEAIGEVAGAPIYHASMAPADYQVLLARNGFKTLKFIAEDPYCGHHTVWLAQYKPAMLTALP